MTETFCRLYLITPPAIDLAVFRGQLEAALDGGDVACVQLRLKACPDDEVLRAADALLPICRNAGVPLIVNDRPDLAAAAGADGVHVGQQDTAYAAARAAIGPAGIVGVTCHDSRHLAIEAAEAGADYVAFGAFYPTDTKRAATRAHPELLSWWQDLMVVPCVAIGGITLENAGALVTAGADFLAVISAVWEHPEGPSAAVAAFNVLFEAAAGR
jgi:thiamine-phosphate pyrophosphorylase